MQDQLNDLQKKLTGGIGDDAFDDMKNGAEDAVKPLKKIKEQAEKVTKSVSDIGKKAAKTAFNGLKKLAGISLKGLTVGIGAAATAIGTLVTKTVSAFAEFEQLKGGVETLFGAKGAKNIKEYAEIVKKPVDKVKDEYKKLKEVEKTVLKDANDAYKTAGLSANDYMTTVTSFSASLISSLKGDTQKAAKYSKTAIVNMSDNANKMGTDIGMLQNAYQGFAKQNYTMLDNLKLGYGGTKTEMERLIKDAAKMKDVQKKLGVTVDANSMSFGNIVQAINVMQESMFINGTTAKEAEGTITGSLNAMKSSFGNLLTAIGSGENLDQCFENMIYSVEIFGNNLIPVAERALSGLGVVIEKLSPKIAEKLPELADKLLPPLIKASVSLVKGLIKALPNIIKTLATTIVDIFGEQFPIIQKIGDFFKNNAGKIANSIKVIIPTVLALAAAFKGFKVVKGITSIFGGGKSKSESGGKKGGFINTLTDFAKMKTTTVLKGMANIGIILGGFIAMTAILLAVAPLINKIGGHTELLKLVVVVGALGVVGGVLAKFGGIAGKIPVATVAKGLANMAIMLGGLSALFMLVGAISLIEAFNYKRILGLVGIIGALGAVGAILAVFGGIVGLIPVPVVALGLANMAIIIAGMSALFLLIAATSLLNFNYVKILKLVGIIGILGTVGATLSIFAGIVGMIPIPVVLAGLTNMGLVLGGITALIVAFGALTEIKGFTAFLEKGGEILVKICNIIGEMAGSLIGGLAEGISDALPAIGENIGKFGENIKPLFSAMQGVDMGGVSSFFKAIVSLLGMATGKGIIDGIKSLFGKKDSESPLAKLGTELSDFATNAKVFFTTVKEIPAESFPKATELFKSLSEIKGLPKANKEGKTAISAIATDLSTFHEKAGGFFTAVKDYDLEKVKQLWEALKGADDVTKNISEKVNEKIDDIVKKVTELPTKMGDGFKSAGKSLADAFVEVWTTAVKASVAPVNKLLDGANWVLKEFGSDKKVISWQPYAKGTNGHKGGNALVNDGSGAELVQMPNGSTFIPKGRNVFLPNAPRGMKVLPAGQTARLMGKKSPTFRYEEGTGKIDIWSYIDNASGLVSKIAEGVNYNGMSGFVLNLGKSMVSTFTGEMSAWVGKLYDEMGAMSLASYNASKGVEQWTSTVTRALKMENQYSAANLKRTLYQMQTESGGNPRAINNWDSNAKKGTPSKGLMQVIDPTFKAYARAGYNKNIYDPLSNILASIRYAVSRYGTLAKAYRGVGYANGTGTIKLDAYTPESSSGSSSSNSVENNTYAPHFEFNVSGTSDDRAMARKIKRMVAEAFEEMLYGYESKNPKTQEV